ncbi:hypothetical protein OIV83_000547 [Microbotryomycetes sp. JL201]|nr:hypothetical protein OIV83_000547 [Microbotryomycetes sp. JL201]
MSDLPAILVTSVVSVGDMIGYKLAEIGIRMVANVAPKFDAFQLEQALKYLEPRPKVVIVGSGVPDDEANEAKQVFEKRPKDLSDCVFVRPSASLLEQSGLEGVFEYIKGQVKDVKAYEMSAQRWIQINPSAPSAVMLGANREMGRRLISAIASRVTTLAFLERDGFMNEALLKLLQCMRPNPRVMLCGPAYDDMFDKLEASFKQFHEHSSGCGENEPLVFVSVEWAVFFKDGGGVDKESGVENVIQYLHAELDEKLHLNTRLG